MVEVQDYVVMPLHDGQLEQQRQYIRSNPRNRLLRMTHRDTLTPQRCAVATALTLTVLRGYLQQKTMNCIVQAICRSSDSLWKE